jgi:hypothetical protein
MQWTFVAWVYGGSAVLIVGYLVYLALRLRRERR